MLRQPHAGVEKRAFRLAGGDPRWVPYWCRGDVSPHQPVPPGTARGTP